MDALAILAETRLQLRGSTEPMLDPKFVGRARRQAEVGVARVDADPLGVAWVQGLRVSRQADGRYLLSAFDPMTREELVDWLEELGR